MALYAVMATDMTQAAPLNARITSLFPAASRKVNDYCWLVVGSGTAQELTEKLGLSKGPETLIVIKSSGYHGYASKDIWEWIATKSEVV